MTDTLLDTIHINFDSEALWTLNVVLSFVMFGVALEISLKDFKQLWLAPKPVLVGVFSQFVLLPLVTLILVFVIQPYPSIALGMFMVAACPGGNISNFITYLGGGNAALSVCLTGIATVLAVILTPLNLQFWGSLYGPSSELLEVVDISPIEMTRLVSLLLGLPLVLGMMVNYWKPKLALKMAKVFKVVSLIFFIFLVFMALWNNREIFLEYILYVFWIVLAHNLLAFSTGYSFARILGLNRKDVKSITIETGIQNSGLGLLLIFTFFDGLGGMALLTAFWGIWHIISGLVLASIWSYRSPEKTLA
ncbi:MAG: bile acid:sodium symporter family protein [Maribacter sp.]